LSIGKFIFKTLIKLSYFFSKVEPSYIKNSGYNIAYLKNKKFKKSTTIIFIHGLNDSKITWLKLIKLVNSKFNIVAIDLLGHGQSSKPLNFNYSLTSQADFLEGVIKDIISKEKIDSYYLAGHSMGGGIAVLLARKLNIKKLLLFAPYGIEVKPSKMKLKAIESKEGKDIWKNICTLKKLKNTLKDLYYKPPKLPNFILKEFVKSKCKNAKIENRVIDALVDDNLNTKDNLTNITKDIKYKTLIFWGEDDFVIDISSAYAFKSAIKNSTLYTYKECGHMLHIKRAKDIAKVLQSSQK